MDRRIVYFLDEEIPHTGFPQDLWCFRDSGPRMVIWLELLADPIGWYPTRCMLVAF